MPGYRLLRGRVTTRAVAATAMFAGAALTAPASAVASGPPQQFFVIGKPLNSSPFPALAWGELALNLGELDQVNCKVTLSGKSGE